MPSNTCSSGVVTIRPRPDSRQGQRRRGIVAPVQRFRPGDPVVIREVWRGRVFEARPTIVVRDDPDGSMFYLPGGVGCGLPIGEDGEELRIPDRPWRHEVRPRGDQPILSFAWPDTSYSVLRWAPSDGRAVWYVNLQEPLARTPLGFDTTDHVSDAIVELDRSAWRWKDEEELADAVARGMFAAAEAEVFRAWGERAVGRIVAGEPPFDRSWDDWRPDPVWRLPRLPRGWDVVASP
jgi:Protein of unknown function (DUF402)